MRSQWNNQMPNYQGSFESWHLERSSYKVAQDNLEEAVKRGNKYQDDYRLVKAMIALGNCYLKQNKDIKALEYLEQALLIAKKHSFETLQFDILLELTDICKRNNLPTYEEYLHAFQLSAIQLRKGVGSSMKETQTLPFTTQADPPTED